MTVRYDATLAAWNSDSKQAAPSGIQEGPVTCINLRNRWLSDLASKEWPVSSRRFSDVPTTPKRFF